MLYTAYTYHSRVGPRKEHAKEKARDVKEKHRHQIYNKEREGAHRPPFNQRFVSLEIVGYDCCFVVRRDALRLGYGL